ncbi:MAG: leucyl aminopeptidase [Promethearchaeota archaeon]|nr:MAG: leucyl aminopeptidase [Candidatus Lokiarchaeota archaeon]
MARGARTVVQTCAKVKAGEMVVILTEPAMGSIAKIVALEVEEVGAEPIIISMIPRISDGQEPPKTAADAMLASDVFISAVKTSITHTHAVKNAVKNGSRGIFMTQFTEEILMGGGIEADFEKIAPICKKFAKILEDGDRVHLMTKNGTDLTYSAKDRRGNALYCLVEPGQFSTIPTIEANCSPVEGSTNGIIVADASIPYIGIGILEEPVKCIVKNGYITSIKGGKQAQILKENLESKNDPNVYNIAEMGIGLNPKCSFLGIMLEDEGVLGSVHIGIGTSITLGGIVKAASHYDLIMKNGTIEVDGMIILQDGKIMI